MSETVRTRWSSDRIKRRLGGLDGLDDGAGVGAPVLLGVRRHVAQVPLGVEGALGAAAGRGDGLAVGVIDEVADREDPGELGLRGRLVDDDIALLAQLYLALDQLGPRPVADRDERAADLDVLLLAGLGVLQPDAG